MTKFRISETPADAGLYSIPKSKSLGPPRLGMMAHEPDPWRCIIGRDEALLNKRIAARGPAPEEPSTSALLGRIRDSAWFGADLVAACDIHAAHMQEYLAVLPSIAHPS